MPRIPQELPARPFRVRSQRWCLSWYVQWFDPDTCKWVAWELLPGRYRVARKYHSPEAARERADRLCETRPYNNVHRQTFAARRRGDWDWPFLPGESGTVLEQLGVARLALPTVLDRATFERKVGT